MTSSIAIVVDMGPCWKAYTALENFNMLFCINRRAFSFSRFQYWVSLHKELMKDWAATYIAETENTAFVVCTTKNISGNTNLSFSGNAHGTSAYYAAKLAIFLGYRYVVLSGVPLPRQYRSAGTERVWLKLKETHPGRISSFSGWTKEVFGQVPAELIRKENLCLL